MNDHPPHLTPAQAREQLAATQTRPLGSARDRRVNALNTAVAGLAIAFLVVTPTTGNLDVGLLLMLPFAALVIGWAWWVERAARTVPHRVRRISAVGIWATFVLVLVLANVLYRTTAYTWPVALITGLVAAVPSLLAAGLIAVGRT